MIGIRVLLGACVAMCLSLPALAEVKIREVTSPGGVDAWLVEDHSIPFTALEIRFRGGTSLDAAGKRGATYLMAALLEEGAGDLKAQDYARKLEGLAAYFSYDARDDALSVSARFLTENRDEAVDMLRLTLNEPRFDQDALDRVRAQIVSGLKSDLKDPRSIAGEVFARSAYADHPYETDGKGTIESVTSLTREDVLAAHRNVLARDRMVVAAVGDIDEAELGQLLDRLFAELPASGAPLPGPATVTIPGGVTVVDFATPQSTALFGHSGIDRDDPDFFAAYILNQILGGGSFESRLMTEVREKRGLTYGVYSYLVPKDNAAIYMGSVASSNDRIAEAIDVIRDEWRKMSEEGVTPKELQDAKTYLTGAYPLRFDGNAQIASIMASMQMQGLPVDYIATRNDQVNAVTLDDVKRVAQELLRPEDLHFVVVGQPEGLETTTN